MELQLLIPSIGIFLTILCTGGGIYFIWKTQQQQRIKDRLQDVILGVDGDIGIQSTILRDMELSTVPIFNEFLKSAGWARRLDNLLVQADLKLRVGSFLMLMLGLGIFGALFTAIGLHYPLFAIPAGCLCAIIPLIYVRQKKISRVRRFEIQFPDALDMLTSALRAGLALTGAIQVVAEESPDPVGKEFRILSEENRLGLDMRDALKKMAARVDSAELNLFVTAVILQRETGGNLAEILQSTAAVIRDRFRILGDVRSMTAQARLSGFVLTVLPLVMAGIVLTVAPDYLKGLLEDPIGPYMIAMAIILQVTGFMIMKRIINIRV